MHRCRSKAQADFWNPTGLRRDAARRGTAVAAGGVPWLYAAVLALSAVVVSAVLTAIQYVAQLADLSRLGLGRTATFWLDMLIRLAKTFLTSLAASFAAAHPFDVVSFDWPTALNVATLAALGALGKGLLARGSDTGATAAGTAAPAGGMMSPSTLPTDTYSKAVGHTSDRTDLPPQGLVPGEAAAQVGEGVGFQNAAMVPDQRFQAAASYSLRSPPRIGRRRILPWTGSGTGDVGRGGRSRSARCGRAVL